MTAASMLIPIQDVARQVVATVPCGQCTAGLGLIVRAVTDSESGEPFEFDVVATHWEDCPNSPSARPTLRAVPS